MQTEKYEIMCACNVLGYHKPDGSTLPSRTMCISHIDWYLSVIYMSVYKKKGGVG